MKKKGNGSPDASFTKDSRMTSSNSKAGLIGGDPNNSTFIQDIPGLVDNGFKKQMTKQELIEKEKKEIEAIKKVL